MSFNTNLFLSEENAEKFKRIDRCSIIASRLVSWGELEPLNLKDLFEYQGLTHFLGLDPQFNEHAVKYFYSNFSLTKKNNEIVGFKTYIRQKKISISLQEFSELIEIPLGGIDIVGCSASRADFGFPPEAIQQTLYLNQATPVTDSLATNFRLPVRVANRILSGNLINKAGNRDDVHEIARVALVCLFRKTKVDWVKYILHTMSRPNLKSLSFASHITNIIYIKNVPTGNWQLTVPDVTPINMSAVNKMLSAGTIETLRDILYHDPPPADLSYTPLVLQRMIKAKAELVEFGKNTDHIPEYKISSKRKTRKATTLTPSYPPPPPPTHSPPRSSSPIPPRRTTREDRVLEAIHSLSLEHQKFATYTHQCFTQLHDEHVYLAKKLDDHFHFHNASFSLMPTPPIPMDGLPFPWPPMAYYTAFPSAAHGSDVPGSSGAGPSSYHAGADTGDADAEAGGAGPSGTAGDGAGPSTSGAADDVDTPME